MQRLFLEKYFPALRVANSRKEICAIRQSNGETLYEYWKKLKKLCSSCPPHQIDDQHLIQYFCEGLLLMDRSMIDATSGGSLVDKTPEAAKNLIANIAANSRQYGTRNDHTLKRVNGVSPSNIEQQISDLTTLVRQMVAGNMQVAKVCGICSMSSHTTDACPILHEDEIVQQDFQQIQWQYPTRQGAPANPGISLEDMFKTFTTQTQQF